MSPPYMNDRCACPYMNSRVTVPAADAYMRRVRLVVFPLVLNPMDVNNHVVKVPEVAAAKVRL